MGGLSTHHFAAYHALGILHGNSPLSAFHENNKSNHSHHHRQQQNDHQRRPLLCSELGEDFGACMGQAHDNSSENNQ
jgi:hypothetical protein